MKSIKYFKKVAWQSGEKFGKAMKSGNQFTFQNVDVDTGFIHIDDVKPTFEFRDLFSTITGDLVVEKKHKSTKSSETKNTNENNFSSSKEEAPRRGWWQRMVH